MLEGFANVWTPVWLARKVKRKPVPVKVAGEQVVLFRGKDGRLGALLDRCPHRGVALSLGKVTDDGCLACPFHGWEFEADGACSHVPYAGPLPASKRARLGAVALPVRELAGLVWIRTSPGADAPDEPHVSPFLVDPAFTRWHLVQEWACHWTRAMENMLDTPHLPFVHGNTIGAGLKKRLTRTSRMEITTRPTPTGFTISSSVDGDRSGEELLSFHRPNQMVLHLRLPMGRSPMHVYCVPVDERRTRMIVVATRDYGRRNPLFRLADQFNRLVVLQDQAVVESSQPPVVPRPAEEASVATDRGTLRFRRYYFDALHDSSAAAPRLVPLALRAAHPTETASAPEQEREWESA